jgi:uncharacterized protein HemY
VRLLAVRSAEHLDRAGQLDAAASILENYLAVHGMEAEILRLLGSLRLRQGRARDASVLLERALTLHFECTATRRAPAAPDADQEQPQAADQDHADEQPHSDEQVDADPHASTLTA